MGLLKGRYEQSEERQIIGGRLQTRLEFNSELIEKAEKARVGNEIEEFERLRERYGMKDVGEKSTLGVGRQRAKTILARIPAI